jgi:hypothetical protein
MSIGTFGIEKEFLHDLLREVRDGQIELPEFQRGWVWPDRHIASLLASISQGYPVGTVMMLRTGGDIRFKQRPVEGATPPARTQVERLILDGQQRLTSLFQALLLDKPVQTQDVRKHPIAGWFYVDIRDALDPHTDREETIRLLPPDKVVRNFRGEPIEDLSTPEQEYERHLFPLARVFDPDDWATGFQEHWDYDRDRIKQWHAFNREFVRRFDQYQVPVIELGRDTPRQAVCQVFEKVNTGGVTLTVFELLTATYAADEYDLRNDWDERRRHWSAPEFRILREVSNTDFLQTVTLLATKARREQALHAGDDPDRAPRIGCRRADMLVLQLEEYQRWAPEAVTGLRRAAKFLHQQYFFDTRFLPYGTQLIPLAAALATLGHDADTASAQQKLARWYWSGVFGELYAGTTETRFARDLPELVAWIKGSPEEPRTVQEAQFAPDRLLTLRTRGSAAYKGIYALLLKEGALDWRTGEPANVTNYFDDAIDIHHIFPRAWCDQGHIDPKIYNSVVNKTPLSARTNRVIGGWAPSQYLSRLANSAGVDPFTIDKHISTHLIDPPTLRTDDFDAFFARRQHLLLDQIATVLGKPIQSNAVASPAVEDIADEEDDTDDL